MATVNGTTGPDVIHVAGDGVTIPPGYTDVTGVTEFADSILAGDGDDIVYGAEGNDTLVGGLGVDTLFGGEGNDAFLFYHPTEASGLAESYDAGLGRNSLGVVSSLSGATWDFTSADISGFSIFFLDASAVDLNVVFRAETFVQFTTLNVFSSTTSDISIIDSLTGDMFNISAGGVVLKLSDSRDELTMSGIFGSDFSVRLNGGSDYLSFESFSIELPYDLRGGEGDDTIEIRRAAGDISGGEGDDFLRSANGLDTLSGGSGDDTLRGGGKQDVIFLGAGADRYSLLNAKHSKPGDDRSDVVFGFSADEGDLIGLSRIDANVNLDGNQAFVLGADVFTGIAGELIQVVIADGLLVQGDTDGDGDADLSIKLIATAPLGAESFIL